MPQTERSCSNLGREDILCSVHGNTDTYWGQLTSRQYLALKKAQMLFNCMHVILVVTSCSNQQRSYFCYSSYKIVS